MLTAPEDNFVKIYERSLREHWDLEAISDWGSDNTLTYGQMAAQIWKLQRLFHHCGVKTDDRIAVMGKNNCNWVTVYLAAVTYGAIIVPILQDFKAEDALHIINHSGSKLLFITDLIYEGMTLDQMEEVRVVYSLTNFNVLATDIKEKKDVSWAWAGKEYDKKFPHGMQKEDLVFKPRKNSEIASINYTSGTTGFSKGVMTPCNALAGHIKFFFTTGLVYPGCRHVAFLPLAHAYGCAVDFLGCLAAGGHTYFIGRTPAPKILIKAFQEVKPTLILSVPLILEKIYKQQIAPQIAKPPVSWVLKVPYLDEMVLAKIRQQLMDVFGGEFAQIIIGGAPLNAEVERFLQRIKFPMTVGYGMTECAPLISWTEYPNSKPGSCGRVLEGLMEAKIVKPNAEGVGEVLVRGEHVMKGYYRNDAATKETFTKDGWLKTGDLGMIDEDGFLFMKGRNKTMLLGPSGQNIYPEEIESKLNNLPYIGESIVLQHEDHLVALVYPDYTAVDQNHLNQEDLLAAMEENRKVLNQQLAAYEQVTKIKLYPHEFEKTPKRSIKRFLYTQMAGD
ncbi:MAG: AMP-binding protein [Paludibacteraceae bacterium]|nr:AMP-binding protein [Paludibacteraceae bacterium]